MESRITTKAKQQENTNKSEAIPFLNAIAVVTEETNAEWLEGIPPVRQNKSSRNCFVLVTEWKISPIITFSSWLIIQLAKADKNSGLYRKLYSCRVNSFSIVKLSSPKISALSRFGRTLAPDRRGMIL